VAVIIVKAVYEVARIIGGYRQELELTGPATVADVLELLIVRYGRELADKLPGDNHALRQTLIFVNGRNIAGLDGWQTVLHDGDELFIMTPLGGG